MSGPGARPGAGQALGEWTFEELLGEGAFGQVWRARAAADPTRRAAVKVPRDERGAALLAAEGAAHERLAGGPFPRLLGLSREPAYAAFELVDGGDLRAALHAGPLAPREAGRVARGVLVALAHAHRAGLVHRDVKPENVLLARDGRVLLADLGLAVPVDLAHSLLDDDEAARGVVAGSLPYLAPEVRGGAEADARSDLYAWGVLLFEALTGALPGAAERPCARVPGLPPIWDDLYLRACGARAERWARAEDALAALDRALEALPAPAPAPAPRPKVDVLALLEEKAREERALVGRTLIAYVTPEGKARARVGGKTHTLDVGALPGLCVLRVTSPTSASVVQRFVAG